jgi:hypothetical protein
LMVELSHDDLVPLPSPSLYHPFPEQCRHYKTLSSASPFYHPLSHPVMRTTFGFLEESFPYQSPTRYSPTPISNPQNIPKTAFCNVNDVVYYDQYIPPRLLNYVVSHLDILLHDKTIQLKNYFPADTVGVAHLIDPFLNPFIKGFTEILPSYLPEFHQSAKISGKYSWLPAEFLVDAEGNVSIESSINNLDQKSHSELYFGLARIFQCLIPMFELKLDQQLKSRTLQVVVNATYHFVPPGKSFQGTRCLFMIC